MAKKVLVRSVYKEVVAKVGEMPTRDHRGQPAMSPVLRQFWDYQCYMTPEEAEFLVNSKEQRALRTSGQADYFFPLGFAQPVDENYEGPLAPAVLSEQLLTGNPSQSLAAKEQLERAATAVAAMEKGANSPMAREFGKHEQPV